MGTGWIQVDSGGFKWILMLPIRDGLCKVSVFAHARGGFSATTSPLYDIKKREEELQSQGPGATSEPNCDF